MGSRFPAPFLIPTSLHPQKKVTGTFPEKLAPALLSWRSAGDPEHLAPGQTSPWLTWGPGQNFFFGGVVVVTDSVPGRSGWSDHGSVCSVRDSGGGGEGWEGVGLAGPKQSGPPDGVPDPVHVSAHFGVDPRLGRCVARDITPGHNALQDASTDQGSPGIPLRGEREAGVRSFGSSVPSPVLTTIHHLKQNPTPPRS